MRLLDAACGTPWLIHEPAMAFVLETLDREHPVKAVETEAGRKLDNTRSVTNRDGVAVVPIKGVIVRSPNIFSELFGDTSIDTLAKDFAAAVKDPAVKGIILNIDSPGGMTNGVAETADMIRAARAVKPVTAYVGNMAASAAYWLASAADEIVMAETAMVGSIGTVIALPNPARQSVKDIEIVSTQSPNKRPDVSTESGRAEFQRIVDEMTTVFIDHVARNRNTTTAKVEADFGKGGVRLGHDAVSKGMASRVGSLEGVIKDIKERPRHQMPRQMAALAAWENQMTAKEMLSRVLNGKKDDAGVTATEEIPNPEAAMDALSAEITQLREKGAQLDAMLAEKAASEAKERALRIDAEVGAFMNDHSDRLGAKAFDEAKALLIEAKNKGTEEGDALAGRIETLVASLPPVGTSERVKAGGAQVDALVADTTGDADNSMGSIDARATAIAKAEGISYADAIARVTKKVA